MCVCCIHVSIHLLVLRRIGAALLRLGPGLAEWNSPGGASAPAKETQALQCFTDKIYISSYIYLSNLLCNLSNFSSSDQKKFSTEEVRK